MAVEGAGDAREHVVSGRDLRVERGVRAELAPGPEVDESRDDRGRPQVHDAAQGHSAGSAGQTAVGGRLDGDGAAGSLLDHADGAGSPSPPIDDHRLRSFRADAACKPPAVRERAGAERFGLLGLDARQASVCLDAATAAARQSSTRRVEQHAGDGRGLVQARPRLDLDLDALRLEADAHAHIALLRPAGPLPSPDESPRGPRDRHVPRGPPNGFFASLPSTDHALPGSMYTARSTRTLRG